MSPQPSSVTALSAPGKVLLTGGYLVLDRAYTGTVFALDARIHVVVQQLRRGHRRGPSGASADAEVGKIEGEEQEAEHTVVVRSPQFVDAVWEYGVQRCENGGGVKVIQKGNGYSFPSHYSVYPLIIVADLFILLIDRAIPSLRPH
jgi:phosphomevalonate kinase